MRLKEEKLYCINLQLGPLGSLFQDYLNHERVILTIESVRELFILREQIFNNGTDKVSRNDKINEVGCEIKVLVQCVDALHHALEVLFLFLIR